MAHLTVAVSVVANRLCAVPPVAENGSLGDDLGRTVTTPYTKIITTVVLRTTLLL
jgi:hypothetical protein